MSDKGKFEEIFSVKYSNLIEIPIDIPALVRNAAETEEDDNMSNDEHQKLNGGPNAACEDENENDADDDDDDNDDEWNELEPFSEPTKCLFCPDVEDTVQAAINHLNDRHGVNLCSILAKFNMDQYGYIKVKNMLIYSDGWSKQSSVSIIFD